MPVNELRMVSGKVFWQDKAFPYGDFASLASKSRVPDDAPIKDKKDFKVIGKNGPRLDAWAKATGTAEFGIDVKLPGMRRAVIVRSPVYGGKPISFNKDEVLAQKGVVDAFRISMASPFSPIVIGQQGRRLLPLMLSGIIQS